MADKILFSSKDFALTSTELICSGNAYNLHSISRVDIVQEKTECAIILFAGGMLLAFGMIYNSTLGQLLGLGVSVAAGFLLYKAYIDNLYTVRVEFNTGIKVSLSVKSKTDCLELAKALNRFSTIPTSYEIA
jgi:hypothetical protein